MISGEIFKSIVGKLATHQDKLVEQQQATGNNNLLIANQQQRSLQLFNELTFAIFWQHQQQEIMQLLRQKPKLVDEVDGYGETALTLALKERRFKIAAEIAQQKRQLNSFEHAVLQQTLADLNFRHPQQFEKIANSADHATQAYLKRFEKNINLPQAKYFGLTLGLKGLMVNGKYSEFSYVGDPFTLLSNRISDYSSQLKKSRYRSHFKTISEAFQFSDTACEFNKNIPGVAAAARLSQRYQKGLMTVVPASWNQHAIGLSLYGDYLVLTNRGTGGDPEHGIQIFKIKNRSAIDQDFFNSILQGAKDGTPARQIMSRIGDVVDPKPVTELSTARQKYNNCGFANPKSSIQALLLIEAAKQQGKSLEKLTASQLKQLRYETRTVYKHFDRSLRNKQVDELVVKLKQADTEQEKNTYYPIAQSYINQHHNLQKHDGAEVGRGYKILNAIPAEDMPGFIQGLNPEARGACQLFIRAHAIQAHYAKNYYEFNQDKQLLTQFAAFEMRLPKAAQSTVEPQQQPGIEGPIEEIQDIEAMLKEIEKLSTPIPAEA